MEPLNLERELTGSLSSSYRGSSTNSMAGQGEGITSQQKEMGTFLGIVGVIMVLFAFLAHHSQRVVKARQIAAEQEAEIEDAKKRQEIIGMFESVKCIMVSVLE